MVKKSIYRSALLGKLAEQEDKFFENFAKDYLMYLGNPKPSKMHIKEMQSMLSHVWLRRKISLDIRLTEREKQCLYLSAQGKSNKEIARFFNKSIRRIEFIRQSIFEKLSCKNIPEAVVKGFQYGEIHFII